MGFRASGGIIPYQGVISLVEDQDIGLHDVTPGVLDKNRDENYGIDVVLDGVRTTWETTSCGIP